MAPKKPITPLDEKYLILPEPPSLLPIVDTHTHLTMTFEIYRSTYNDAKYTNIFDFFQGLYDGKNVEAIIDVWCESPASEDWKNWRILADSAVTLDDRTTKWNGIEYWFAIGVHPHYAKDYTEEVEKELSDALAHPRCVALGEIGLDYHYDNSPRDSQRRAFASQLRLAVKLGKPITIHTREAEEDTLLLLDEIVPKDHPIHVHCFTDTPEFAQKLLDRFPNLVIGVTGVVTYSTNRNTSRVLSNMFALPDSPIDPPSEITEGSVECIPKAEVDTEVWASRLRIVLETDAPFMVPTNVSRSIGLNSRQKLPHSHTAMIPWIAQAVSNIGGGMLTVDQVMQIAREGARRVYGV